METEPLPQRAASAVRGALEERSLLRNSLLIMLTTAVNLGLGYLFWILVTRSFTASEVGVGSALIAAMTLLAAIANLGTSPALVQHLPTRTTDDDWSRTLLASAATASLAGLAIAVLSALVIIPELSPRLSVLRSSPGYAAVFVVGVVLWGLSLISDYLFIAERRTENMLARNFVFGASKIVIVGVAAAAAWNSPLTILGAWVAGCTLSIWAAYAVLMPRLARRFRPRQAGLYREARALATSYVGNYLITLGTLLPIFVLPVLVVTRASAAENAYFYVTWLLGSAFFTISSAVGSALFAEGVNDPRELEAQTRSSIRIIAAILAPVMLLFVVAGDELLGLFGPDYADEGATLLLVLTASAIPDAITNVYVARLRSQGRLRLPAAMNVGMAVITLGGAWLLLPEMGLEGVGVAWIAAQTCGSVVVAVDVARERRRSPRQEGRERRPASR